MNKRILSENEYFFWLCNLEYLSYDYIIKHNNDMEYNLYMLLSLENKGFISTNEYAFHKSKTIIITEKGQLFYEDATSRKIRSHQKIDKIINASKKKSIKYLISYLKKYNYSFHQDYQTNTFICKKQFGKYNIYFFTYNEFLVWKKDNNDFFDKMKNLNIITYSLKDKTKIEYDINLFILSKFPKMIEFQEDSLSYSVSLISDIQETKDYPRIIPKNSNAIYKKFIESEVYKSYRSNYYYHPDIYNGNEITEQKNVLYKQ